MQPHIKDMVKIKIKMKIKMDKKRHTSEKVTPLVNVPALHKRDLICIKPKTYREGGERSRGEANHQLWLQKPSVSSHYVAQRELKDV